MSNVGGIYISNRSVSTFSKSVSEKEGVMLRRRAGWAQVVGYDHALPLPDAGFAPMIPQWAGSLLCQCVEMLMRDDYFGDRSLRKPPPLIFGNA